MKLSNIKLNKKNPRIIKNDKFYKLKKSIENFPQMMSLRPIVVDSENIILGGNMRYNAIKELGYSEIPDNWIKKTSDLSEEQKKEFIIKDNIGFGEWEWDELSNEWDVESLEDWGLDVPVFSNNIEDIICDVEVPKASKDHKTKMGDIWELGNNRLLCGDSTILDDVNKLICDNEIDFVYTDPMYNDDVTDLIKILNTIDCDHFLIMSTFKQAIEIYNKSGMNFNFDLVWNQKIPSSMLNKKVPYYLHKNIIYMTKNKETIFNCDNSKGYITDNGYYPSIIEAPKNTQEKHGLSKNVNGVVEMLSGFKFNTVLDLYMGGGSTLIACEKLKRKCYGIELDPIYCDIIVNRYIQFCTTNNIEYTVNLNGEKYNGKLISEL